MALQFNINYLTVLIASIASFILGWLWYGPLFGKTWMRLNNLSDNDIKKPKQKGMTTSLIINFIGTVITVTVISVFINSIGPTSIVEAIGVIFWAWMGFIISTTLLGSVLWDNKPWELFMLNGSYWLINLIIMVSIIFLI